VQGAGLYLACFENASDITILFPKPKLVDFLDSVFPKSKLLSKDAADFKVENLAAFGMVHYKEECCRVEAEWRLEIEA